MADQDEYTGRLAHPGEPCQTPPHKDWTEPEKWAWQQICEGRPADFNIRYGRTLDTNNPGHWTGYEMMVRGIRSTFLESILLHEPWRSAIPRQGVRIGGAWFEGNLDLSYSLVKSELLLLACRFENDFDLRFGQLERNLLLSKSIINGNCELDGIQVAGTIFMDEGRYNKATNLREAKVLGQISMNKSVFIGKLFMNGIKVDSHLQIKESKLNEVWLLGAELGGQLNIRKSTFCETLTMDYIKIANDLIVRNCKIEKEMRLIAAKVGGDVNMMDSHFNGRLTLQAIEVGDGLFFLGDEYKKNVILIFAKIGRIIIIDGNSFEKELDLTGTKVDRVLDRKEVWPTKLHLDDFTYKHLGGTHEDYESQDMTERPANWFIDWLARQKNYSPQPYEHCANVLREAGRPDMANAVLHAAKTRERKIASPFRWLWQRLFGVKGDPAKPRLRWLWLTLLRFAVGYGLGWRYFVYPLALALGLTFLGAWIASGIHTWPDEYTFWNCIISSNGLFKPCVFETHNFGWRLLFSLDRLLPIVELSKDHNTIYFAGWYRFYFNFFQPLAGWILALLVIAGLRPAQKL